MKMKKFGFTKGDRLHLKKEFQDIFDNGKKKVWKNLVLWWKPDPSGERRIGIVVSRKLGPAVERNRAKRLIREVFRLNRHKMKSGAALIISPRASENLKDYGMAEQTILELWENAGLMNTQDENIRGK
ncbi:ribonuclease P protein component [Parelusimicrobium proximum]|uniref:ribonuclease P protein component n=1 Tax=Parelusimicrobium proximum TaxID=3228953 RepID=UPI003D16DEB7